MDNNKRIKVDFITMKDGKQFTLYDGSDKKDAAQSVKFAELLISRSDEPAIVVRNDNPSDPTKAIAGVGGKMMTILIKSINQMIIDKVIDGLNQVGLSVTVDDIDEIYFIKDDREVNNRLIAHYLGDAENDEIRVKRMEADILVSHAPSYAEVVVNGLEYYMYFYSEPKSDKKSCVISDDIVAIWKTMGTLGYTNTYIAFMTQSNPYAIEDYCGIPVEEDYIKLLIKELGKDVVKELMEGVDDDEEEEEEDMK